MKGSLCTSSCRVGWREDKEQLIFESVVVEKAKATKGQINLFSYLNTPNLLTTSSIQDNWFHISLSQCFEVSKVFGSSCGWMAFQPISTLIITSDPIRIRGGTCLRNSLATFWFCLALNSFKHWCIMVDVMALQLNMTHGLTATWSAWCT